MKHSDLIDLTNFFVTEDTKLKKISDEGICFGFTAMATNAAALNNNFENFNRILNFLDVRQAWSTT